MDQEVNNTSFLQSQTFKRLLLTQKYIFLKKCITLDILLPSNRKKGIDFDLLLIQQKRKLHNQLKEIEAKTKNNNYLFNQLTNKQKSFLNKACFKQKFHYKRKVTWLFNKQKEDRKLYKLNERKFYPKNKSIKNKKDRQRYLIRKKNKESKSTKETVLNKSDVVLNNYDIELLSLGPQFIPTPKWESKIILKEKV